MSYCCCWEKNIAILQCKIYTIQIYKSQIVPTVGRVGQLILNNSVNIIEVLRSQKSKNPTPNLDHSANRVDTDWVGGRRSGVDRGLGNRRGRVFGVGSWPFSIYIFILFLIIQLELNK